ncbi:putative urea active transporter 1 [Lasiodiplodia theobromae]|uniref:Putative urea active transporter 1 n=1 Tax=Lasiodiplodia theobromae TaxID=45133 RepID=A0A5N5CXY8_9PEZI|nr:putative urea active transporter 1 [Lasiodiplodia theobromae]
MSSTPPFFSPGVGYALVVGLGAAFAIGMSLLSWGLSRYMAEVQTSEMYMTAKHSVKTGLVATAVVSSWTIAATLLSSTTDGYLYGVSGPFWYACGATFQIFMFALAAIELKRKAPRAHTFLEVVKKRYGPPGHITLMCYSLIFQIFTTVNLLVGGSTLYSSMTGMNRDAACFLFPIGVLIYTLFGGIKATFLTDWAHTVIIYIVMLTTLFMVYTTSSAIGSPDRMWELLREAAALHPVDGNMEGSYLTMKSPGGGYIGLIFMGASFASCVDSQLFQKAIAADPSATYPGYMLGGLCWFTIPFVLASTFGLAAVATEHLPIFPTYPARMTTEEVSAGMAMPYAAYAVMGKGGVIAVLLMGFMAVTSAMSSETVATAALGTYDIYKAYINPNATSAQLVRVSHTIVIIFGVVVAAISVAFNHAGFSVNYLITSIGIFVDSAIVPMACTIMWRKQSLAAVIIAPLCSTVAAAVAWFCTAYTHYGAVTIDTTSQPLPLVAGNMMSICGPMVLTPLITYIKPANFDWEVFKQIKSDVGTLEELQSQSRRQQQQQHGDDDDHDEITAAATPQVVVVAKNGAEKKADDNNNDNEEEEEDNERRHDEEVNARLLVARKKAAICCVVLCLCLCILWPIPMYGSNYVFSKPFFRGWIVVVFLWGFFAAIAITCYPIWEGRASIARFFRYAMGRSAKQGPIEGVVVLRREDGNSGHESAAESDAKTAEKME